MPYRPFKDAPDLLTPTMLADKLSVSIRTLWRLVERGDVPAPIRFNRKLVRWRAAEVQAWLDGCGREGAAS
jgi:predicted DNA-binding transcriptional regulator AlpA